MSEKSRCSAEKPKPQWRRLLPVAIARATARTATWINPVHQSGLGSLEKFLCSALSKQLLKAELANIFLNTESCFFCKLFALLEWKFDMKVRREVELHLIRASLAVCSLNRWLGVHDKRASVENLSVRARLAQSHWTRLGGERKNAILHGFSRPAYHKRSFFTNFTIARTIGNNLEDPRQPEIKTTRFRDCTSLFRN